MAVILVYPNNGRVGVVFTMFDVSIICSRERGGEREKEYEMVVILKENRQENKIERETKNKMANSLPTLRLLLSISFFLLFFPVVDLSGPHLPRQRLRPNKRGHHLYCSAFHSQFTPLTHVHDPFVYLGWFLSHAPVVL